MSRVVIILAIAAITGTAASTYLWRELRIEREQAQSLQARIAQLEKSESRLTIAPPHSLRDEPESGDTEATAPSRPQVTAQAPTPTAPSSQVIASNETDTRRGRRMNGFDQQQRMLKDPLYREMMLAQHRMSLERANGDLGQMLGISQQQADQLLDVLAQQQLRAMDDGAMRFRPDGAPDQAAMQDRQRRIAETARKNEMEMANLLGPAKMAEYKEYQQQTWSRMQVNQLQQTLAGSNDPLRADQVKPLVEAIAREQASLQQAQQNPFGRARVVDPEERLRMQEEWLERSAQSHQRIRDAVSGLLSPDQLARLERQQAQEHRMQELNIRMQRARAEERARRGDVDEEGSVGTLGTTYPIPGR